MKRDVQEGQARCLAHLGRHTEALEIATNLVSGLVAYFPFAFLGFLNSLFSKTKTKTTSCQQQNLRVWISRGKSSVVQELCNEQFRALDSHFLVTFFSFLCYA